MASSIVKTGLHAFNDRFRHHRGGSHPSAFYLFTFPSALYFFTLLPFCVSNYLFYLSDGLGRLHNHRYLCTDSNGLCKFNYNNLVNL